MRAIKDFIDNPDRFYSAIYAASGEAQPGRALAEVLSLATSTCNRWARPAESDEDPTATGRRSDLARLVLTFKAFALRGDQSGIEACQQVVYALQHLIDEEIERRAGYQVSSQDEAEIKEDAIRATGSLAAAIGTDKSPSDVIAEMANQDVKVKLYAARKRIRFDGAQVR